MGEVRPHMSRGFLASLAVSLTALPVAGSHPSAQAPAQASKAATAAQPASADAQAALVKQYCVTCHNARANTGNLSLESVSLTDIPGGAQTWEKVIRKVRAGMMPPAGMPRPPQAALDGLVAHLETTIDKAALAAPQLRRPTLHRLNRSEYANA